MIGKLLNATKGATCGDIGNFGSNYHVERMYYAGVDLYPILKVADDKDWQDEELITNKVVKFLIRIETYIKENNLQDITDVVVDLKPYWVKYFIDVINNHPTIQYKFNVHIPIWNTHKTVIKDIVCLNKKIEG